MKSIFLSSFLCLSLSVIGLFAQAQTIAYQGTAVNATGQLLTNQSVALRLSVLDGSATGTAVYVETQAKTSSASGTFTVQVGAGTAVTGTFASVNLMANTHFLKVEMDPAGGTNYVLLSNGPVAASIAVGGFVCGSPIIINHTAGAVAPVSKSVTYGTVTNIPGATTKCWITSNLGADHQATSVDDASEASAGWYWQFNRKQGYKNDGSADTPAWTITNISENSDWLTANDPCTSELGSGWRLPTSTEWSNANAFGNWTDWTGPWDSGLKLHAVGFLANSNGLLGYRGSYGHYWSSTQGSSNNLGWGLNFHSGDSSMGYSNKADGFSVRCITD